MKLAIHLLTWNGASYVPFLIDSLVQQSYADWHLFVRDNASTDGTVALLEQYARQRLPNKMTIEKNSTNRGFAIGYNQLLRQSDALYQLILNQDMALDPMCLEKLMAWVEQHTEGVVAAPRLMRWQFPDRFSDIIDGIGLRILPSRRVVDAYAGVAWGKEAHKGDTGTGAHEVFGVSGAMLMAHRTVFAAVAFSDGTIFDEQYGSYKEDVDLAYRLQGAGYRSYVVMDAVVYHDRGAPSYHNTGMRRTMKQKQGQSKTVRYMSYRNHLMTLYKNEYWENVIVDFPWICWFELQKIIYWLFFDRFVLTAWKDIWRLRHDLVAKRREIQRKKKRVWYDLRAWWTDSFSKI